MKYIVTTFLFLVMTLITSPCISASSDIQQRYQQVSAIILKDPHQALQELENLATLVKPDRLLQLAQYYALKSEAYSALGFGEKTLQTSMQGIDLINQINAKSNSQPIQAQKLLAQLYIHKASGHYFISDYPQGYDAAMQSLKIAKQINDKTQIGYSLLSVAEMTDVMGKHENSLAFILEAQEYSSSLEDKKLSAQVFSTLGNLYISMEQNELAIESYQKSLELHDPEQLFSINILNFNIANALYQLDKNEQALHYLDRVIQDSKLLNDGSTLAYAYFTESEIYAEEKKYAKALNLLLASEKIIRGIDDSSELFNILTSKLTIYLALNELAQAEVLLDEINRLMGSEPNILMQRDWHHTSQMFWKAKQNFQKAHFHAMEYAYYDHIYMLDSTSDKMQNLKLQFETQENELQREKLARLNVQQEIALTKSNAQKNQYWYISIITSMTLIFFSVFLYRQQKHKAVLSKLATYDELTGLRNRRSTKKLIDKEFKRYLRYKECFCIALFDIDSFKQFNDSFGHAVGDQVLAKLGKKLPPLLRSNDVLCRWGGEEFLLLLPNTELKDAISLGERLLDRTRRIRLDKVNTNLKVSFSMGVVQVNNQTDCIDELVNKADKAVYRAKAAGKNQVVSAAD